MVDYKGRTQIIVNGDQSHPQLRSGQRRGPLAVRRTDRQLHSLAVRFEDTAICMSGYRGAAAFASRSMRPAT